VGAHPTFAETKKANVCGTGPPAKKYGRTITRITRTGRVGLVLIALGLVPLACWTVWFRTRTWGPVDIPISLSQGSHFSTGEFAINLNGRYEIEIETTNKIPLDILHCLLGNGMRSKQACSVPSVVNVHWTLSGNGTVIQGTSDNTKEYGGEVGATGEASRTIGIFRGQKGRRYKLDCDVLADGRIHCSEISRMV
jgi:hypothetical protein